MGFKCKECNSAFDDKKHLENHRKVHERIHGRKQNQYSSDRESRKYDSVDPGSSMLRNNY
jgi:hypothetical protein